MNKFIIKIALFILPLLLSAVAMEFLIRAIPNDYTYKSDYLDNHAQEIETLILGSSHSYYGLNPVYFSSNAFNAGHVSQSLNFDYEILTKYWDNFDCLEVLIIPVSYFTIWEDLENGSESWRVKNYNIYYKIKDSDSLEDNYEIFGGKLKINILKIMKYYLKGKSLVAIDKLGWGTGYKSEENKDLDTTGVSAAERHTKKDGIYSEKRIKIYEKNVSRLESIILLCEEKNVKILFFTPPAYETYRNNLNNIQLNKTIETNSEIVKAHSNCTYINLLADKRFVAEDFYDADHLNEIGAEKLSKIIDELIQNNTRTHNRHFGISDGVSSQKQ